MNDDPEVKGVLDLMDEVDDNNNKKGVFMKAISTRVLKPETKGPNYIHHNRKVRVNLILFSLIFFFVLF